MPAFAFIERIIAPIRRALEGSVRPGPYALPISGGWLPPDAPWNWWQGGMRPSSFPKSAIVESCVSAYAHTVAMCSGSHWREKPGGGRERVENSAASRILLKPNSYQTNTDFLMTTTRDLYSDGNSYALALRNDRFEVDELHLMKANLSRPIVSAGGDVFYYLGGNEVIERMFGGGSIIVPQRDVLHVKLAPSETRSPYPLIGESPLAAAALDVAMSSAASAQTLAFLQNSARPSAVLSTDLTLSREEAEQLRQRWDDQSRGMAAGKTPILSSGLKVLPWNVSSRDSQIAELLKLSDQKVAMIYGVPLPVLGLSDAKYANTEALMHQWVASGLGFCLSHIESSFDRLFRLAGEPFSYCEFDTSVLLRSAFKDRIDGLTAGIQGGLFSPNEARLLEGLSPAAFGDEPRLQAQVIPLSAAGKIPSSAPSAPAAPVAPVVDEPAAKRLSASAIRAGGENILAAAERAAAPSPSSKQIRR